MAPRIPRPPTRSNQPRPNASPAAKRLGSCNVSARAKSATAQGPNFRRGVGMDHGDRLPRPRCRRARLVKELRTAPQQRVAGSAEIDAVPTQQHAASLAVAGPGGDRFAILLRVHPAHDEGDLLPIDPADDGKGVALTGAAAVADVAAGEGPVWRDLLDRQGRAALVGPDRVRLERLGLAGRARGDEARRGQQRAADEAPQEPVASNVPMLPTISGGEPLRQRPGRPSPAKNPQEAAVPAGFNLVEQRGIEPLTSTLRTSRSPN